VKFVLPLKLVWKRLLVVGVLFLALGLIFMVAAFSVGPAVLLLALYGMGMLIIGFGLSSFIFALVMRQLSKSEEMNPPPPPPS
jgi:membrane protein implicated in regulation of membrane protease activity